MQVRTHVLVRLAVVVGAVATMVAAPSPAASRPAPAAATKIEITPPTVDDLLLRREAQERASRSARRQALITARRIAERRRQIARRRKIARLEAIAAARRRAAAATRQAADALTASSTAWARSPEAVHVYMCESGGNIHAVNGQYLGKWQMDPSFWSTYGGLQFASTPLGATEAEQDYVAWRGWKARGWSPWQCA